MYQVSLVDSVSIVTRISAHLRGGLSTQKKSPLTTSKVTHLRYLQIHIILNSLITIQGRTSHQDNHHQEITLCPRKGPLSVGDNSTTSTRISWGERRISPISNPGMPNL